MDARHDRQVSKAHGPCMLLGPCSCCTAQRLIPVHATNN